MTDEEYERRIAEIMERENVDRRTAEQMLEVELGGDVWRDDAPARKES